MSKNNPTYFPLLLGLFTSVAFLIGVYNNQGNKYSVNSKIEQIINLIDKNYVDSVDKTNLVEQSINGLLKNLDPHSVYIPAKETQLANESLQGHFGGIGIRFMILRDTLMVTDVINGGPSKLAGLLSGDRIIKVNNDSITDVGITNQAVFKLLKGKIGSTVNVTTYSTISKKKTTHTINRGMIPLPSVDAAFMLTAEIGYIKLSSFSDKTPIEFRAAVKELSSIGAKNLILDLRNNSGGYLHGAISVSDEFLVANKLIVYTEGLHQKRQNHYATKSGSFENGGVVVLINSGSASASEIVAGAIQDNDRGTIIGRRSFGKGLVQQPIKLGDNSELRLTISRYYSPTGRCIQKPYGDGENYNNELLERYESGQMYSPDTSLFSDQKKFITPKGKIVFGGGGISPDVFVSLDSSEFSSYYSSIYYSSAVRDFCFDNFEKINASNFSKIEEFSRDFKVSKKMLDQFTSYAEENNQIPISEKLSSITIDRIKKQLKREFSSYFFDQESRYFLSTKDDDDITMAIKVLENKN